MGNKPQRSVSLLSDKASDKLMAALNCWSIPRRDMPLSDYQAACHRWRNLMTPEEREHLMVVMNAYAGPRRADAEGLAALLPNAPKYPGD
jgi:hypothetical protein